MMAAGGFHPNKPPAPADTPYPHPEWSDRAGKVQDDKEQHLHQRARQTDKAGPGAAPSPALGTLYSGFPKRS